MRTILVWAVLAALLLAAGACSSARVEVAYQGVAPLNPNEAKESTSVNVRFYRLKDEKRFRSATVEALWTDDKKELADDQLGDPQIATVYPGAAGDQPVKLALDLPEGTRFIGVLALYRRSDAVDKRALVVPLDDVRNKVLTFSGFAVTVVDPAQPGAGKP